ncbi:MAG: riboflavin synthase [Chlorobi bacterium]|nr:riboflavin synthase [Chlorobiota bacterium]
MFTGIIETVTTLMNYTDEGNNRHFELANPFPGEISVDQSIAHDGVCLTVVKVTKESYTVTAIDETLKRSNLRFWKPGTRINVERALRLSDRLDGHIVQGHVDQTAVVRSVEPAGGSWIFTFEFSDKPLHVLVEKGSAAVNGVSLTVFDIGERTFKVAIIPYTFEHTNFGDLRPGDTVNVEFDMIGKYVERLVDPYLKR